MPSNLGKCEQTSLYIAFQFPEFVPGYIWLMHYWSQSDYLRYFFFIWCINYRIKVIGVHDNYIYKISIRYVFLSELWFSVLKSSCHWNISFWERELFEQKNNTLDVYKYRQQLNFYFSIYSFKKVSLSIYGISNPC